MQKGQARDSRNEITRGAKNSKRGRDWRSEVGPIKKDERRVARSDPGKGEGQQPGRKGQRRKAEVSNKRRRSAQRENKKPNLEKMKEPDEDRHCGNNEETLFVRPEKFLHLFPAGGKLPRPVDFKNEPGQIARSKQRDSENESTDHRSRERPENRVFARIEKQTERAPEKEREHVGGFFEDNEREGEGAACLFAAHEPG